MKRSLRFLILPSLLSFTVLPSLVGFAEDSPTAEYRLKAAFVSKFPQFVEWPPVALSKRRTLDLCVATPNPFGRELKDLVSGEQVNGRSLAVREVDQDLAGCQVLFIAGRSTSGRHPLLENALDRPILTVGDDPAFLDHGGIVELKVVDGRVRFEVNADAAQRANLRISSQLLRLALNVRGGAK